MNKLCADIRKDILIQSKICGHGRLPTDFSIVELLISTYETMKHDPKNPKMPNRDLFVLSKGHAALAHYCVLAHYGYFAKDLIGSTGAFLSSFGCHSDRLKVPGIEVSTGSLGHGIGVAVGLALGSRLNEKGNHVYVLVGDGESNEGAVWEAVMVAVNLKLDNLTILYDHNHSQTRCLQIENPAERFRAFECEVYEVNGHSVDEIKNALSQKQSCPKVVVGNTYKGYGCKTLVEDKFAWHRRTPNDQEFQMLMEELNACSIS